jgi:hypothetical protein
VSRALFPLLFFLLLGCARTYYAQVSPILSDLESGSYDAALETIDERLDRGTFLYHLEKGTILNYAGRYEESNAEFEQAEIIREDLYTRSIAKEALSFLTSDRSKPYRGEDFEDVLVNYYMAMNYLALGEFEDVLVECRKLNHKLAVLNDLYEEKNRYDEDAFAEYLTGAVYESDGDCDDALISYKAALRAYDDYWTDYGTPIPGYLPLDLIRASQACRFADEVAFFREKFDVQGEVGHPENEGEILFVFENGRIPPKDEIFVNIPIPEDGDDVYVARMAFSTYEPKAPYVSHGEIVSGERSERTELMEDLQAIAAKHMEDVRGREVARTIARGAAKYLAYKGVKEGVEAAVRDESKEKDETAEAVGKAAGALVNLFGFATEHADTRSWLTLPAEIHVARLPLPEGDHDLVANFYDRAGNLVERVTYEDVRVNAGEITFLRHRVF